MMPVTLDVRPSETAEVYNGGTIPTSSRIGLPWPDEPRPTIVAFATVRQPGEPEPSARRQLEDLAVLRHRLGALEGLHMGWLDGEGDPPAPAALLRARSILAGLLGQQVPRPRVYPTPDGGVQAEWTAGSYEISVTFEPDGTLYAAAVDTDSGASEELEDGDAEQLAQFVLRAK